MRELIRDGQRKERQVLGGVDPLGVVCRDTTNLSSADYTGDTAERFGQQPALAAILSSTPRSW